jgi:indole-3-glycerol phosphate synthase
VASLSEPGVRIVAEIKHRSPSAGEILHGADGVIETVALAYRRGHAAAISVVTEEDHFGGRADWLTRARRISGLPCLMKDFFLEERQLDDAASVGADAVLLIVRALSDADLAALREGARRRGMAAVVEAHDEEEIRRAVAVAPDVLGVNARDLATFQTSLERVAALAPSIPAGPVKMAESGISTREEIDRLAAAGYRVFLVGEALLRSEEREQLLRELQR